MELGAELAEREVGLRREDQDEQPGPQVQLAGHQSQADPHRDERDREGREQLQDERGQEGDPQRRQRLAAVVVGRLLERGDLDAGAPENLERGQAGHHVEEVVREARQRVPATAPAALRGHADEDHEQHDQGHRGQDRDRGDGVRSEDRQDHHDRHDRRQDELRQVLREVAVEGIDAARGERDDLAAPGRGRPARAHPDGAPQERQAQRRLHLRGGPVGGRLPGPGDAGPGGEHQPEQGDGAAQGRQPGPVLERRADRVGQKACLGDR